ncbi:GDSL-type esterase/lipase family protein [Paenibacillus sp. TRM 82003]|nr:GDSL-type esterase/lipase family protein [Paenibacillus sp. TRM 82003]
MTASYVYTAVGDSLTFGTGAPKDKGFSQLVRDEAGALLASVDYRNHGVVGATTEETLERVRTDARLRSDLADANLVTVTSGGNDLIQAAMRMYLEGVARSMKPPMKRFAIRYRELIDELVKVNRTLERDARLIVTDCYNPFPQVRDAVLWIQFVNRCIHRTAAAYPGKVYVARAYEAFLGKEETLFDEDGVHPNEAGHAILAASVQAALAQGRAAGW